MSLFLSNKYVGTFSAACALCLLMIQIPLASATPRVPQFQVPPLISVGTSPTQVAAADFNGDGFIDLAVTDQSGVSVLLGNGDGTFQAPVSYKLANAQPGYAIVVADMNNDGIPDLVVTTFLTQKAVQILLGNGDGTFQAAKGSEAAGSGSLAVGDFNGDGKLDVVIGYFGKSIGVMLGNGDGTLQPAFNYAIVGNGDAYSVAVADINGDGKPDIVVGCNSVDVFLGKGDGTFQAAEVVANEVGAYQVATGVFGTDAGPDIIFRAGKGVAVLLNQGGGTFGSYIVTQTPNLSGGFVLGDFNGDGKTDVAVSGLGIFLGEGNGKFSAGPTYEAYSGGFIAAGDVNGDHKLDVIEIVNNQGSVALYFGNGNGTIQAPRLFATGESENLVALGDFNGDGKLDIAAVGSNNSGPVLSILLGNGNGTFRPPLPSINAIGFKAMLVGDFNNDGKLDIAILNYVNNNTGEVAIFLGNGDGTFQSPLTTNAGFDAVAFAAGDFNGDGKLDLAVVNSCINDVNCQNGTVTILLGAGNGTFTTGSTINVGANPNSIAAGNFINGGPLDLVVANNGSGGKGSNTSFLVGVGDGTFQTPVSVNGGASENSVIAGDFNGDGNLDFAVINGGTAPTVSVIFGAGNGTFHRPIATSANVGGPMAAADFNGDGKLDLAFPLDAILTGNGNGTFQPPLFLTPGLNFSSVAPGLLGNDRLPDLVLGANNGVVVVANLTL